MYFRGRGLFLFTMQMDTICAAGMDTICSVSVPQKQETDTVSHRWHTGTRSTTGTSATGSMHIKLTTNQAGLNYLTCQCVGKCNLHGPLKYVATIKTITQYWLDSILNYRPLCCTFQCISVWITKCIRNLSSYSIHTWPGKSMYAQ